MADWQVTRGNLVVSDAAHTIIAYVLGLTSDPRTTSLPNGDLAFRKRHVVLLHSDQAAAELFYYSPPSETGFVAEVIGQLLIREHEVQAGKLKHAARRLVLRHHELILELALRMSAERPMDLWEVQRFLRSRLHKPSDCSMSDAC